MATITCPNGSDICSTMEGAGAGLGVFIQYMGQALPVLLIILAMVGIIVAVGYGIAYVIKGSIQKVHIR
jgi:F0F1-type ATP synthase assembly protein I